MNLHKVLLITALTGSIFLKSCKFLKEPVQVNSLSLPDRFTDSLSSKENIAKLSWQKLFDDQLLNTLVATAMQNNYSLQIAQQQVEIYQQNTQRIAAMRLPIVGGGIWGGIRRFGRYTMDGAGNTSTEMVPGQIVPENLPDLNVGLLASWEVDLWGKLKNEKKAALARFEASQDAKRLIETHLVAHICDGYFNLIALDQSKEILKQTLDYQQQALEIARIQKDAGKITELAVQQFEAQILNITLMLLTIEQQIVATENELHALIGQMPKTIERKSLLEMDKLDSLVAIGLPSELLENRPDIRAAKQEVLATAFELQASKAAFLPQINLNAGIGYQAFDPSYLFISPASIFYQALGNITAPLVNFKALKTQFYTAKATQLQALCNFQQSILVAFTEVVSQLNLYQMLSAQIELKKQQALLLTQSVETANELFKNGKADYFEVLLAQSNALSTRLELVELQKNKVLARIYLYKALGGGWQ